ncbi:MAG: hypothetical protein D6725_17040 [Planctomycetota bacterium]|nr:MAG: hypothetical protein D6725_17040 [Planctomycetota bacterium]
MRKSGTASDLSVDFLKWVNDEMKKELDCEYDDGALCQLSDGVKTLLTACLWAATLVAIGLASW